MAIQTRPVPYKIGDADYEGVIAFDDEHQGPRPGVLVAHAWAGRSDFEVEKAKRLAELGYTGFAIDLFGKGVLGTSVEENQGLIAPFVGDRSMLQDRLATILEIASKETEFDATRRAAIGFCFGGLCVLDMARSNAALAGVVSFHGLLGAPGNTASSIQPKILAFHGWDDPMAPPADVTALGAELTSAKADWQLHGYGGVLHAFTNPDANDPDFGTVYNVTADARSWTAMENFLAELFEA